MSDYALLSDRHGSALVADDGALDWCCLPRFDHGSCFARLLDGERGGALVVRAPDGDRLNGSQRYRDDTMVLETTVDCRGATVRFHDALLLGEDGASAPHQLARRVDCLAGRAELELRIAPRFDYGEVRPWLRCDDPRRAWAIGGDDALDVWAEAGVERIGDHELVVELGLDAGERSWLSLGMHAAAEAERRPPPADAAELERRLEATAAAWRRLAATLDRCPDATTRRSALILLALVYAPSGAIVAAPTTSLPEAEGGSRNWDYRYSWIRDSVFAGRTLARVGNEQAADRFERFALRSAAGHADELQVLFGIGGERRIEERELSLCGYGGARPVRVGNGAAEQAQLDTLGELVNLAWERHQRGRTPDGDEWRFLRSVADAAAARWRAPDRGIWEWRGPRRQLVHSKAACWAALDRGARLAEALGDGDAPTARWRRERDAVADAIARDGWDERRGAFVQAFGARELDAAALLLPVTGFVEWDDARMVGTADAIADALDDDGLVRRYDGDDGLPGREGAFLACSFWLSEALARQGRLDAAWRRYERALATASPTGLWSEQHDPAAGAPLGNYPQALTHLAQIGARLALHDAG
nr:glycoside hydrolase family 15 protein [Conexibacter arvalis]